LELGIDYHLDEINSKTALQSLSKKNFTGKSSIPGSLTINTRRTLSKTDQEA